MQIHSAPRAALAALMALMASLCACSSSRGHASPEPSAASAEASIQAPSASPTASELPDLSSLGAGAPELVPLVNGTASARLPAFSVAGGKPFTVHDTCVGGGLWELYRDGEKAAGARCDGVPGHLQIFTDGGVQHLNVRVVGKATWEARVVAA